MRKFSSASEMAYFDLFLFSDTGRNFPFFALGCLNTKAGTDGKDPACTRLQQYFSSFTVHLSTLLVGLPIPDHVCLNYLSLCKQRRFARKCGLLNPVSYGVEYPVVRVGCFVLSSKIKNECEHALSSDIFLCLHCNTNVSVSILLLFIIDKAYSINTSSQNSGLVTLKSILTHGKINLSIAYYHVRVQTIIPVFFFFCQTCSIYEDCSPSGCHLTFTSLDIFDVGRSVLG